MQIMDISNHALYEGFALCMYHANLRKETEYFHCVMAWLVALVCGQLLRPATMKKTRNRLLDLTPSCFACPRCAVLLRRRIRANPPKTQSHRLASVWPHKGLGFCARLKKQSETYTLKSWCNSLLVALQFGRRFRSPSAPYKLQISLLFSFLLSLSFPSQPRHRKTTWIQSLPPLYSIQQTWFCWLPLVWAQLLGLADINLLNCLAKRSKR